MCWKCVCTCARLHIYLFIYASACINLFICIAESIYLVNLSMHHFSTLTIERLYQEEECCAFCKLSVASVCIACYGICTPSVSGLCVEYLVFSCVKYCAFAHCVLLIFEIDIARFPLHMFVRWALHVVSYVLEVCMYVCTPTYLSIYLCMYMHQYANLSRGPSCIHMCNCMCACTHGLSVCLLFFSCAAGSVAMVVSHSNK